MYVLSRVDISIVMDATLRARPCTDIKRKGVENMPTLKTPFGGRVPLVNLDKVASVPRCFVFQLRHKLTPTHVTDRFTQLGVLDHVLDLQVFDADRLIFTNQAGRKFVREITAAISDTSIDPGKLLALLLSILAALLFPGKATPGLGKLLFILAEEGGIANYLPGRQNCEGLESQVCTDGSIRVRQMCNVHFYQDTDIVTVCTVLGDGHTVWPRTFRQRAAPHNSQWRLHPGEGKTGSIPLEGIGGIGSRLLVALLLEGRVLGTSLKEVEKCTIQMSQALLQGNRRDFIQPAVFRLLLELGQGFAQILVVEATLLFVECIRLLTQGPVVDETSTAKGTGKNALLLIGRVHSVLVRSLLFHVYMIACQGVNVKQSPALP